MKKSNATKISDTRPNFTEIVAKVNDAMSKVAEYEEQYYKNGEQTIFYRTNEWNISVIISELKVRIKCIKCNKIVSIKKDVFERTIKKLGIDKDDYIKIYYCENCKEEHLDTTLPEWSCISEIPNLSLDFIEKYKRKLWWDNISMFQTLPEWFIEKHKNKINWFYISYNQKLSEQFIEKYKNKLYWDGIWEKQKLSEAFIEKHKRRVNWYRISKYQKLSEQFIEKYKDKLDWERISQYQKLSEAFIEKHKDEVDWKLISRYQKLSEQFIEKYRTKVDWNNVSRYQKLSPEFVAKYINRIRKSIFDNRYYKTYPDSLKLILKQKFNK